MTTCDYHKYGHVLCIVNSDGSGQRQLTTSSANETDPSWVGDRLAFLTGGEIWTMASDGSDRRQLSHTDGKVEGYKFSPDGSRVVYLQSIPFHDIIQENPSDLPKATGRLVTDLMYRHWDHYVESIAHPFVAEVTATGIGAGTDILSGEPYECPMEPFGGIEQLDWSRDSKQLAYTCRKKTGLAYSISTDSDIYLYDVEKKSTRNLCKPAGYRAPAVDATKTLRTQSVNAPENLKNHPGYDQNPQFSPDGKYVAWLSMARDGYESDRQRLCVYDLATGKEQFLTETFDSNVDDFCWSDNKDALLYFIGVWHGTENLYAVNWKGELKQLTNDWADFGSLKMLGDGNVYFVACSQWLASEAKRSALLKGHKITNIPNPIDTHIFRKCDQREARQRLGLPMEKRLLLFVSQRVTNPNKGMDYLVKACEMIGDIPNMGIVILGGHGEDVAGLLPLETYPLGYVSDDRHIVDVYNAVDLFVLPSLSENLPNSIMEAMACGVPSVGFNVGGIPEEIDHKKNGYVAAYRDAEDLARGIRWVLCEADATELSAQCQAKVARNYSQSAVAMRYTEVYNQALAMKHYKL